MMASINKAIIVGNLGDNPDSKFMPSGDPVTTISVATTDKWKDKSTGEIKEQTEWHRVVFFGRLAEIAGQYLKKGSQVYVEGRLKTNKWTDKDGIERYSTQITGDVLQMLGSRKEEAESDRQSSATSSNAKPEKKQQATSFPDDDIPF